MVTKIQLTQIISDVEAWGACVTDALKVVLAPGIGTGVNHLPLRENNELVEQSDDVTARLVDREDNGAVVIASQ